MPCTCGTARPISTPICRPNAYSAYLDFQWASDPKLQIGAELGFRVGAYTDFNTLNDDSLRIQGLALGMSRLTPTWTLKLGAMYLDRNNIKILPAGGLLWTPTPQVRFDFFFPQPKLSAYLTTVGRYRAVVVRGGRIRRRRVDDRAGRRHERPDRHQRHPRLGRLRMDRPAA